jgi:hypothetical protein
MLSPETLSHFSQNNLHRAIADFPLPRERRESANV